MKLEKDITFFYTDKVEYQTLEPIFNEAKSRGFQVKFSKDIKEKAEIGIYCHHPPFYPENSKLSIITIHGIDQGSASWPNFWKKERWDQFDIGLLPGKVWSDMWINSSWYPPARTRLGIYELGWPKADVIFSDLPAFEKSIVEMKSTLQLKHPFSILYAPSFETDGKQDDVVSQLRGLPVNIIVKQWASESYKDKYPDIFENVNKLRERHKGIENVYFLDPDSNIMHALGLSDILITDESSVMYEALLLDIPSVTISDWPMRTNNSNQPRLINVDCEFIVKVENKKISQKINHMMENYQKEVSLLNNQKESYYCELGQASKKIVNLVEEVVSDKVSSEGLLLTNKKLRYDKYFKIVCSNILKKSLLYRVVKKILVFSLRGFSER